LDSIGESDKVERDVSEKVEAAGDDPRAADQGAISESEEVVAQMANDMVNEFWRD
jgi:hypothetical protein